MASSEDFKPLATCDICQPELLTQDGYRRGDTLDGIQLNSSDQYKVDFGIQEASDTSDSKSDSDSSSEEEQPSSASAHIRDTRGTAKLAGTRRRAKNTKHYYEYYADVNTPTGNRFNMPTPAREQLKNCQVNSMRAKLYTLSHRSREYKIVMNEMANTIVTLVNCRENCEVQYRFIKIERVINGCLWRRYQTRKRDVANECGNANERLLFHGTSGVNDIIRTGFDERYSSSNGQFGAGIYFARNSNLADQFVFGHFGGNGCKRHKDKDCTICERRMLLCRVILGKPKKMTYAENMAHPPAEYHSVEAVVNPGVFAYPEYVIYRGEQAYPEYLITYKVQHNNSRQAHRT